ncbi:MAG TPA: bifunctional phosphopantothenoylcysteine decarboxylase/phosphopantothenate--cysteine ligase CoaBC [Aeromonadales bacterium]|nr:bifunctional phosphopantothenoylcysteine decarboxylase/phosphopantothenate--cysteine ligase CoaBC [Aeromonadales bacterium]
MSQNIQQNDSSLYGKQIILGITGGIAAYKSADLLRRLIKAGATVQVVMTKGAQAFLTPLTFQALSGLAVRTDLLDTESEAAMGHIELAKWADLVLIAPCSADFMAKLANGLADDLLSTLCLATDAPVAIAPAMNQQMYKTAVTQQNLLRLNQQQRLIWGPASGVQACGDQGPGRMEEPEILFARVAHQFKLTNTLQGINVLLTAGPTQEAIDPVRYIGNRSSGKMGYALAEALQEAGANVCLISGPVNLPSPVADCVKVQTADEMYQQVFARIAEQDIFIGCAAVADYKVKEIATQKIKKNDKQLALTLIKNPDIISEVATFENRPTLVVGFAAETENLLDNASAKLLRKNLDLICANDVGSLTTGFASDQNKILLLMRSSEEHIESEQLPLASKKELSKQIVNIIAQRYNQKKSK